ncbi:MAG: hypothetical protein M3Z13_02265 [Candidatus Dormibacteraeota bacterium]|nr:hypothetical protein [Candidatus Dormibacteraeota bacterium]
MKAISLEGRTLTAADVEGRVLTHDIGAGLRKGLVLVAADAIRLREAGEVHVVELEPGDLHEDLAGRRIAEAIAAGGSLAVVGPRQSQYRLVARARGLLRVNPAVLGKLNALSGVAIFTLFDGQAVEAGDEVAGCKVTPVAVPEQVVREAAYMALEFRVLELRPFLPLRTSIVVTEKLKAASRAQFTAAVGRKLGWYGAQLLDVVEVARNRAAVAEAYRDTTAAGAELVLFAGASSIDPLDPAYSELERAGGELIRFGMPAHPGSMLWMGRLRNATVLGIASCAGFGKNTSLDLVLPFVFSGSPIDLASLGHGGLIETSPGRRFPPYAGGTGST